MLTLPIEAEIETEHKVIRNLNKRQTICAGAVLVTTFGFYAFTKDVVNTLLLTAPFACFFAYLGWKVTNGLHAEELALMKAKNYFYKNSTRKYRTKNMYFALMNAGYRNLRNKDMADKRIAKKILKEEKYRNNRKAISKMKKIL